MKKIKAFALLVIALLCLNVIVLSTKSAKAEELPEVTITCNTGGSGVCYEQIWFMWILSDCEATGNPMDVCW
ncbi:MAG: hypothetical protein L3J54_10085 [Draconibacterium sp.]|nr:hypothetical protein [Draconibacterium sp.]